MTKTISVCIYETLTLDDLQKILVMLDRTTLKLSGSVAVTKIKGGLFEFEITDDNYELDE